MYLVAYVGGVLTILSPCILPVLPFVFARADQPFVKSGLPLLAGMAVTFAPGRELAAVGGGWAVHAESYGASRRDDRAGGVRRRAVFPALAERLTRPLVRAGSSSRSARPRRRLVGSVVRARHRHRFAVGAVRGPNPRAYSRRRGGAGSERTDPILLFAYALGAATSLAVALLAGGRVFAAMKRSLGAGEWFRRGLGVACWSASSASRTDWIRACSPECRSSSTADRSRGAGRPRAAATDPTPAERCCPSKGRCRRSGADQWLNCPPLTTHRLCAAKSFSIDFWTYSCINCLRALPYVRGLGGQIQGRAGSSSSACTRRSSLSREIVERARRRSGPRNYLSRSARQPLRDLDAFNNRILAGALFHRCETAGSPPSFRRRRTTTSRSSVIQQLLTEAERGCFPAEL